jgi:hypothetical protein
VSTLLRAHPLGDSWPGGSAIQGTRGGTDGWAGFSVSRRTDPDSATGAEDLEVELDQALEEQVQVVLLAVARLHRAPGTSTASVGRGSTHAGKQLRRQSEHSRDAPCRPSSPERNLATPQPARRYPPLLSPQSAGAQAPKRRVAEAGSRPGTRSAGPPSTHSRSTRPHRDRPSCLCSNRGRPAHTRTRTHARPGPGSDGAARAPQEGSRALQPTQRSCASFGMASHTRSACVERKDTTAAATVGNAGGSGST